MGSKLLVLYRIGPDVLKESQMKAFYHLNDCENYNISKGSNNVKINYVF